MIQIYHNEKLKIKWHGTAALNMYEYALCMQSIRGGMDVIVQ